jgi:hypothetical protein
MKWQLYSTKRIIKSPVFGGYFSSPDRLANPAAGKNIMRPSIAMLTFAASLSTNK